MIRLRQGGADVLVYGNIAPLTDEDVRDLEAVTDHLGAYLVVALEAGCIGCGHHAEHSRELQLIGGTCADCPACAMARAYAEDRSDD
jgi:hypothetical protein